MDNLVGQVLQDRYKVIDKVASGGMGVVYRGERLEIHRPVAIKFVHAWAAAEPQMRKRFEIEVRAMGRIHHPCCVSITDFGVHDGAPYVVMDFVDGHTLAELIEDGPLPVARALEIADKILAGLAHAHDKGVVHRDIKPKNIMVRASEGFGDEVRILDFGLAKLREQTTGLTVGMAIGTPSYMAPEQTLGQAVDARTDVYTVGLVLYEMLAGETPFWSDETHELMRMQREDEPAPIEGLAPSLWNVVARALAKSPDDRYASAAELAAALRKAGNAAAGKKAAKARAGNAPTVPVQPVTPAPIVAPQPTPLVTKDLGPATPPPSRVSGSMVAQPVRPGRRKTAWIIGGCVGGVALISIIAIAMTRGGGDSPAAAFDQGKKAKVGHKRHAAAKKSVTPPAPTADDGEQDTGDPIERVEKLIAAHQTGRAVRALTRLERKQPKNARVHYLLGTLHFAQPWYSEAIKDYLAAIRLDANYRSDETLIKHIIYLLRVPKYSRKASWVLHKHIGKPAVPQLEKFAAATKNRRLKQRARWVLKQIRGS